MRKLKSLCLQSIGIAALAIGLGAHAADKPTLKIGYVNGWDDSVAATHVAGEILKEKLGYGVELKRKMNLPKGKLVTGLFHF